MENPANFEKLLTGEYKKLANFLKDLHLPHNQETLTKKLIKEVHALQKFSFTNKNQFYLVFDHVKFLPIYLSDNIVNCTGYTAQEMCNLTSFQFIKRLYWKQMPALFQAHILGTSFRKLNKLSSSKNHEIFFCGIKWKDKGGHLTTFLGKQKFLATDKNGEPTLSFIQGENITPIYKSDYGWMQIADYSIDIPLIRVYSLQGKKNSQLLSDRELDIVRLITQKMDSAAIANQLQISVETVKKHRKNMIAKVGTKDMTSLIYICRQANMI